MIEKLRILRIPSVKAPKVADYSATTAGQLLVVAVGQARIELAQHGLTIETAFAEHPIIDTHHRHATAVPLAPVFASVDIAHLQFAGPAQQRLKLLEQQLTEMAAASAIHLKSN